VCPIGMPKASGAPWASLLTAVYSQSCFDYNLRTEVLLLVQILSFVDA